MFPSLLGVKLLFDMSQARNQQSTVLEVFFSATWMVPLDSYFEIKFQACGKKGSPTSVPRGIKL